MFQGRHFTICISMCLAVTMILTLICLILCVIHFSAYSSQPETGTALKNIVIETLQNSSSLETLFNTSELQRNVLKIIEMKVNSLTQQFMTQTTRLQNHIQTLEQQLNHTIHKLSLTGQGKPVAC